MADITSKYHDIPEEDRKKADAFFLRAKTVGDTGNFDFAIEMYLMGLDKDPENVEAHQALRDISLKRKASGGKDLGMFAKMGLKRSAKDDKQSMLVAEKLLAYDPGNTDHMVSILLSSHKCGYFDTVQWIGPILLKANADAKSPEFNKFITLKNIYKDIERWKEATEACQQAVRLRPDEMDLQTELKNLGAQDTMMQGGYTTAKSFRDSVRDLKGQSKLLDGDKDIRSQDSLMQSVREAEAEWKADPDESGKLARYLDALERTELTENENLAIELLEQAFSKTKRFNFRQRIGKIKMTQLRRMERPLRAQLEAAKGDPARQQEYERLLHDYQTFRQDQIQFELQEYQLAAQAYPTDSSLRFEVAVRLVELKRHLDAIPALQQVRQDPKYRFKAGLLLGRSFLDAGFVVESVETLQTLIDEYQLRDDETSREAFYWSGRALETKGEVAAALKRYSQVFQWSSNYRDVQSRIRKLREQESQERPGR